MTLTTNHQNIDHQQPLNPHSHLKVGYNLVLSITILTIGTWFVWSSGPQQSDVNLQKEKGFDSGVPAASPMPKLVKGWRR